MTRLLSIVACAFVGCIACETRAAQPSFDCAKAKYEEEKLVCEDTELAALDRAMADLYASLRAATPKDRRQGLKSEQIAWIKNRNACAARSGREQCVRTLYQRRIEELRTASPKGTEAGTMSGKRPRPITDKDVSNASLLLATQDGGAFADEVKLTDGTATVGTRDDGSFLTADIVEHAFGNLDGDSVGDAAVVVAYNTGGSGVFISLTAVVAGAPAVFPV